MEDIKFLSIVLPLLSIVIGLIIRFEIRFNKLSIKLTVLEQRVEPFWEIIKNNVSKLFTENPSAALLEKMNIIDTLSIDELTEAQKEFEEEMETVDSSKKINYVMAIYMIKVVMAGKKK